MKKSIYQKHVKLILKRDRIMIQRKGSDVIICDAPSALKVPYIVYKYELMPMSSIFVDLHDGESYDWNKDAGGIIEKSQTLFEMFDGGSYKSPVVETEFLMEAVDSHKKVLARLCNVCGNPALFNSAYLSAMSEYCGTLFGNGSIGAIKWKGDISGCMLLPMRYQFLMEKLRELRMMIK